MKNYISIIISFFILFSCNSNSSNSSDTTETPKEKTADELRQELKQKEQQEPSKYLKTQAGMRRNLIDETVVEGTISNSSTSATFKDPVLEIVFLSKTNTQLSVQRKQVFELLSPGNSVKFKIKTFTSKDVQKCDSSPKIISATAVEQ
jgi:hypothetical protein